jgi:hypothetical protein
LYGNAGAFVKQDGTFWVNDSGKTEKYLDHAAIPKAGEPAITAKASASSVSVNGKAVSFDAYNIGGSNYFKLRDLAYALNGTEKQFEVGYDAATKAITLTSGAPYTPAAGEMEGKGAGDMPAAPTPSNITLDGNAADFDEIGRAHV